MVLAQEFFKQIRWLFHRCPFPAFFRPIYSVFIPTKRTFVWWNKNWVNLVIFFPLFILCKSTANECALFMRTNLPHYMHLPLSIRHKTQASDSHVAMYIRKDDTTPLALHYHTLFSICTARDYRLTLYYSLTPPDIVAHEAAELAEPV
jgi:hypothetical protein